MFIDYEIQYVYHINFYNFRAVPINIAHKILEGAKNHILKFILKYKLLKETGMKNNSQ